MKRQKVVRKVIAEIGIGIDIKQGRAGQGIGDRGSSKRMMSAIREMDVIRGDATRDIVR
jgi:hypothetical protein